MDENRYSKKESRKEELRPIQDKPEIKNEYEIPHFNIPPIEYTKQDGEKSSKLLVIISGGEVRELNYFKFFNKPCFHRIRIIAVSDNGGIETKMLVEKANVEFEKLSESSTINDPDNYSGKYFYLPQNLHFLPLCR